MRQELDDMVGTSQSKCEISSTDHAAGNAALHGPWLGQGSGTGKINLGEIEVAEINSFEFIWGSHLSHDKRKCVSFYKPIDIPEGFFSLGHYCQPNKKPMCGFVLVARDLVTSNDSERARSPALLPPCDYSLVWKSDDGMGMYDP
ncbi:hypothetical protein KSS87_003154, partial [Heliosperma pusillum]